LQAQTDSGKASDELGAGINEDNLGTSVTKNLNSHFKLMGTKEGRKEN
jgi:hypothetical protein